MRETFLTAFARLSLSAFALTTLAAPARAEDDRVAPVSDALVLKECGSCHMAFQPAFLPAAAWDKMMNTLADHFGEDVRLPADKTEAIRTYLVRNATGSGHGHDGKRQATGIDTVPLRITETGYFLRKHRFPDRVWQAPKVVTKSNCVACHVDAERGIYEDD